VYNVTLRRIHVTIVAVEKAISIKYSECVTVLLPWLSGIQIISFLCHILSPVACLSLPYFTTLSHERHILEKH
jgi:hypothetical protein